jgi:hypothetical protein
MEMVLSNDNEVVIIGDAGNYTTVLAGVQGPAGMSGGSGNGSAIAITFAWGDATPDLIATVPAGKVVFKVELVLMNAFNVASTLTVGDSSDHASLFNVSGLDLTETGTYQSNPDHLYASSTPINIYISLGGGVSAGNGIILVYIQE